MGIKVGKPVGSHPQEIDGIVLRKSTEMPPGMQSIWDEDNGVCLWVGQIGTNPHPNVVHAWDSGKIKRSITLSPIDYEIAVKSHLDEAMRRAKRARSPYVGGHRMQ